MIAAKGKKDPALLQERRRGVGGETFVVDLKPLRFGEYVLKPGTEVPGAGDWLRIESWVDARRVRAVSEGEPYLSFKDFLEEIAYSETVVQVLDRPVVEDDEPGE